MWLCVIEKGIGLKRVEWKKSLHLRPHLHLSVSTGYALYLVSSSDNRYLQYLSKSHHHNTSDRQPLHPAPTNDLTTQSLQNKQQSFTPFERVLTTYAHSEQLLQISLSFFPSPPLSLFSRYTNILDPTRRSSASHEVPAERMSELFRFAYLG